MKKFTLFLILSLLIQLSCIAQFDGAVGTVGCRAISKDDSRIVSWAKGCQVVRGYQDIASPGQGVVSFGTIQNVLNAATDNTTDAVSLGDGGYAIITFDRPVVNGAGYDFAVFENSFDDSFLELAFVEVSSDGEHFFRFPATSLTDTNVQTGSFGALDPTKLNNLAGKYRIGWGTPFDLEELPQDENLDIMNIRFVKIIDVIGTIDPVFASRDASGNIINDPYPTNFNSGGFDLTGVAVLNSGNPYIVSNVNSLLTMPDTVLMPDGTSGVADSAGMIYSHYTDGIFNFNNSYSTDYDGYYNDGFVISTRQNNTIQNYDHSAITQGGMEGPGKAYLSAYYAGYGVNSCTIEFNDSIARRVEGCYVTNSTTAFISMQNGDWLAKKFGGEDGTDPDWFKMTVIGYNGDAEAGRTEYYLADFRSNLSSEDYIVTDWRWLDLASLGEITSLEFMLSSSDNGELGMNTPAYFCLDRITVFPSANDTTSVTHYVEPSVKIYPNPCTDFITVSGGNNSLLTIYNSFGQKLYQENISEETVTINMSNYTPGIYIVRIQNKNFAKGYKIIRK